VGREIGIATSPCYDCPKPPEFGPAGKVWGQSGWRVDVRWFELKSQIKPAQLMATIAMYLPETYSPLQTSGAGLQSVYLTHVPDSLANELINLIGSEASHARGMAQSWVSDITAPDAPALALAEWEQDLAEQIETSAGLTVTEKRQVILACRGQGKFRERVARIEHACRITGVNRPEHLIASHCKPWRECESNDERLDGENGPLLTPTVDHDRNWRCAGIAGGASRVAEADGDRGRGKGERGGVFGGAEAVSGVSPGGSVFGGEGEARVALEYCGKAGRFDGGAARMVAK